MILHRFETGVHLMARTPFKPGKFVRNWSFQDEELPPEPEKEEPNSILKTLSKSCCIAHRCREFSCISRHSTL